MGRADADKKQLQFWTLDEFICFINTFEDGSKYHLLFDLLFYSGCRIGEALALTSTDIDTVNRRISITKTYFRHKGNDEITEPKTRGSVRTVIIPEFLAEERIHTALQEALDENELYQSAEKEVDEMLNELQKAGLSREQNKVVAKALSAANASGAIYATAYKQGLYDGIKLMSEVNRISEDGSILSGQKFDDEKAM